MIGNFLKHLDSSLASPYVPRLKCGTPFSDMVNMMGQASNAQNVYKTNQANKEMTALNNETQIQLAREANEMSQHQFETNLAWLREQFFTNAQREDTKYQRTVSDIMRSGLNPALMSGMSPSSVSSVGAPSQSNFHVAQTEAAHFDPMYLDFDPLASGVSRSIDSYFQNKKTQAETHNIEQDSQNKTIQNWTQFQRDVASYLRMMAETDKILADKSVSEETKELVRQNRENAKQQYELIKKQFDDLAVQPKKENRVFDSQADNLESLTELNKIEAQFKPALLRANIRLSQENANAMNAAAALSWENAKTQYHERNDLLPKRIKEQDLINNYLSVRYGSEVSYEKFVKDHQYQDERNAIRILGELLHNLRPALK